jgi:DNA polymerase elongation subunit (family B)
VEGWILDTYIQGANAIVWVKTLEGTVLKLHEPYSPSLFALPKSREAGESLLQAVSEHPSVLEACLEDKYTDLGSPEKHTLLHVRLKGIIGCKQLLNRLEDFPGVECLYNTDLLHVQQYLFSNLSVPPTSKVQASYEGEGLHRVDVLDDQKQVEPPNFSVLFFSIRLEPKSLTPSPRRDPITGIRLSDGIQEQMIEGEEPEILQGLNQQILSRDPDFLAAPSLDYFTIPYLSHRARLQGVTIDLGREAPESPYMGKSLTYRAPGRVLLDRYTYEEIGLPGVVETSRFSVLPPGLASRWTANRLIDSRNCYELTRRGYVIPRNQGYYEYVRPLDELVARDRGGLIISPKIGLVHENVAELDFESQYPNLIVRDGLSYETVTPEGVIPRTDPLLPHVTKSFLERRLYFKRLKKKYPEDSREWQWCEDRQVALKSILVCLYGTSGCCWNRYGNVLCFEEINRRSRATMVETKDYVQSMGYEVVYADTDSIFVKKDGATREEYENLGKMISERLGLPIALDHHYRYLLLLPLESDPSGTMEAQKHYFGILMDGELVMRGIETRRHDTPLFLKDFQENLIRKLFSPDIVEEVPSTGYREAVKYIHETIRKIEKRQVLVEQLAVSKTLRRPLATYSRLFPHISAAINLAHHGKVLQIGEDVDFVYVNARHHNPLRRVVPIDVYHGDIYDSQKYCEMVLDAAETILSTFGFSRSIYGLRPATQTFLPDLLESQRGETRLKTNGTTRFPH